MSYGFDANDEIIVLAAVKRLKHQAKFIVQSVDRLLYKGFGDLLESFLMVESLLNSTPSPKPARHLIDYGF